ncbi:MAG TPA: SDR family oxidoreductase [Thermoanaerobaculia bacterium]|jgi:3-oxoacyl-[acyl-carrier protein] reductase|nr:SDR family oxidoreductase [Thermoanaerobaculia bacterium]
MSYRLGLEGRRVLITGGSRGIGAACARRFAEAGSAVLVQYRDHAEAAERLLGELPAPAAFGHLAWGVDLSNPQEIPALFDFVRERWGGLDVLVNNAGIWVEGSLAKLDGAQLGEHLAATLALNLAAPFLLVREALSLFADSPDPSIINVSSTAGQRGESRYSAYAASKGALIAATKSWAVELAPRIRVNAVAPGWVVTDMTAEALRGQAEREAEAGIPLGRIATADDIAGPILFLASPLARHVTGEVLNVNGGSVLCG